MSASYLTERLAWSRWVDRTVEPLRWRVRGREAARRAVACLSLADLRRRCGERGEAARLLAQAGEYRRMAAVRS